MFTFAITSGSGSSMGSAHSTVTTFPHTFTLPLINLRRACAAVLWSSYSKKQKPLFFFLSSGWWYKITSFSPSERKRKYGNKKESRFHLHSTYIDIAHDDNLPLCYRNNLTLDVYGRAVIYLPVTLANSSTICSLVLLLGMDPTNSLLLATEIQTPMCLPGRISLLLHCKSCKISGNSFRVDR